MYSFIFFFSSRRRHTILQGDWSSDVCSSDLEQVGQLANGRRLAGAVHTDDQGDLRMMAVQHRLLHRVEDLADLVLDEEIGRASWREREITWVGQSDY